MSTNNCTPSSVYGPFNAHTMFLGCTVVGFTTTLGQNEQPTEITVRLIKDTCPAPAERPKYYWDSNLYEQTTTDADPGFIGDVYNIVGCPAYFRMGSFEFAGIIQRYERSNESSINPQYDVVLIAPIGLLNNSQIILNRYAGPLKPDGLFTEAPNNVFNAYGYLEGVDGISAPLVSQTSEGVYNLGDSGPDGAIFGTAAGAFGGSLVNENGITWNRLKGAISVLTSATPIASNMWSPHGRLTHVGLIVSSLAAPYNNGYGLMAADAVINFRAVSEYTLDISELPSMPSYFRINNNNSSLLDIISNVCQSAGYDYFVELVPIRNMYGSAGSGIAKIIKIRTINRNLQPDLTFISNFIAEKTAQGIVVNSAIGRELRDEINSAFLYGASKQTIYQLYQSVDPDGSTSNNNTAYSSPQDAIVPYYGTNIDGSMIRNNMFETTLLEPKLVLTSFTGAQIYIDDLEFAAALESYEEWETYIYENQTETNSALQTSYPIDAVFSPYYIERDRKKIKQRFSNFIIADNGAKINLAPIASRDINMYQNNLSKFSENASADAESLKIEWENDQKEVYDYVRNIADKYYGKAWAVRIPYTAAYYDSENDKVIYSDEPTDGGWTEVPYILGLENPSADLDFFKNENNQITAFMAFSNNLIDTSLLKSEEYLINGDIIYVKATAQPKYVFHNVNTLEFPRAVVELSTSLVQIIEGAIEGAGGKDKLLLEAGIEGNKKQDLSSRLQATVAGNTAYWPGIGAIASVTGAVIPIKSNVLTYGPWSSIGPPGGVTISQDESLAPWQYGSYATMNTAGQELVNAGLTNMQVGEVGSITIVGFPDLPLGGEIGAGAALNGSHLLENRGALYSNFGGNFNGVPFSTQFLRTSYGLTWNGTYGPNVTSMQVVGGEQVQTTYSMRTYTNKFGHLAQLNANRLKQVGQQKLNLDKRVRAIADFNNLVGSAKSEGQRLNESFNSNMNKLARLKKKVWSQTPHEVLVAQVIGPEDNSGSGFYSGVSSGIYRTIVATYPISELANAYHDYERKAYMSWDGLIRPVSLDGAGGLPRFAQIVGSGDSTSTIFAADSFGQITGTGTTSIAISAFDLNPFFNPTGYQHNFTTKHTGVYGHGIDMVGRATGVSGAIGQYGIATHISLSGDPTGFSNCNYSNDYRFVAWNGPVVMQGWGYDTNNKPIPNQADTLGNLHQGIFTSSGLTDNFYPNFGVDSRTWPVGPIDLRWDRSRRVWTAASPVQEKMCKLLGHLGPQDSTLMLILKEEPQRVSGTGELLGWSKLVPASGEYIDTSGNPIAYPVASGYNISNNLYASGCELLFSYSNEFGRWEVKKESEITVLLSGTISGATWDSNITGLRPYKFSCPVFEPSVHGLSYNTGHLITGWNKYPDTLTPGDGSAYIASIVNGWLDNASCTKVTL